MKILFLSRWFPYPADNGSKLRVFNLLKALASCHDVTLLSFTAPSGSQPDLSALQNVCRECYTVPWREFNPNSRRARLGFLSSKPRFILDTYSPEMESEIRRLVSKDNYDLVIASQLTMASYHQAFENTPAVFEELELGAFYEQAHSRIGGLKHVRNWLTWFKLKTYLSCTLRSFALCTVVSEKEKEVFVRAFSRHKPKVLVLPNCLDLTQYQVSGVERKQNHLVFSGSFRYVANYHAMLWFLEKVYPLILENVSNTQLLITGDHAGLSLPMTKNVQLTGHVEDIKSLIASCDVSIVPIWSGGGTRLKILEAMALGTPVVATSKGAEGLNALNGEHILIADEPEDFAAQVIQILRDRQFSKELANNALHLVKEQYDWAKMMPKFLETIEKVTVGSS